LIYLKHSEQQKWPDVPASHASLKMIYGTESVGFVRNVLWRKSVWMFTNKYKKEIWSNCVNNKLYAIYETVGSVVHNKGLSRHESVIINRLRIGHTILTGTAAIHVHTKIQ